MLSARPSRLREQSLPHGQRTRAAAPTPAPPCQNCQGPDSFGPRLRFQGGIFVSLRPPPGSPGPAAQHRGRTGAPRDRQRAGWGHVPTAEPGGVPRSGGRLQIYGTITRGNIGAGSPGVRCAGGTLVGAGRDGAQLPLKHRLDLPPLIQGCCYLLAPSTASLSRRFNYLPGCCSILILGPSPAAFRGRQGSAWHRGMGDASPQGCGSGGA